MLLSYNELCKLVDDGVLQGVKPEHINAASIDITLGNTFQLESFANGERTHIDLAKRQAPAFVQHHALDGEAFILPPNGFCLAHSKEVFNLPDNISAEVKLKSSMARSGLDHALALWRDAGWNGSTLTFEFKNNLQHHSLILRPGMSIAQVIFYKHEPVPKERSYATRGRYNHDTTVSAIKE